MNKRRNCLVLRPGALGDTIVSLPSFAAIAKAFGDCRTILASSPAGNRIGILSGIFDKTIPYDSADLLHLFSDSIQTPVPFADTAVLVAFGAGGADEIAARAARAGVPVTAAVDTWPVAGGAHISEQLLERTLEAIEPFIDQTISSGADYLPDNLLDFSEPEQLFESPSPQVVPDLTLWKARPGLKIAVAPGSGSPGKCWAPEKFAEACRLISRELSCHVILILGPAEIERPDIRQAFIGQEITLSESWSIPDLAGLLSATDLYIGNDSGLSHLAAWCNAQTIAVFGPTNPELWSPLGPVTIAEMESLSPESLADIALRLLSCSTTESG
jgi:Glycosyltransferase family 9 (heptosyltransferase)